LFHRLNVFPIHLPPLRDRKEDIPLLIEHFLREMERLRLPVFEVGERTLGILLNHSWPGNVRELKHGMERMVALGAENLPDFEDSLRTTGDLMTRSGACAHQGTCRSGKCRSPRDIVPVRESEMRLISDALAVTGGNRAEAAGLLKISRTTLYRRMRANRSL
jgi:DNA-binding NtrC family response regulator